jgi:TusA-related sulfurtransferase
MNSEAAVKLDMSGLSCPLPLLGAKKILDELADGQHMVLISDCPGTGDDLRAWAGITGHEVIKAEPINGKRVAYTIRAAGVHAPAATSCSTCAARPRARSTTRQLLDGMQPGEYWC